MYGDGKSQNRNDYLDFFLSAGPPLLDKAVQHVLRNEHKKKSVEEGTHEISNGKTYRVIKGDHLGGNVNFKYRGYNSDLKEMGIKHWTQK